MISLRIVFTAIDDPKHKHKQADLDKPRRIENDGKYDTHYQTNYDRYLEGNKAETKDLAARAAPEKLEAVPEVAQLHISHSSRTTLKAQAFTFLEENLGVPDNTLELEAKVEELELLAEKLRGGIRSLEDDKRTVEVKLKKAVDGLDAWNKRDQAWTDYAKGLESMIAGSGRRWPNGLRKSKPNPINIKKA